MPGVKLFKLGGLAVYNPQYTTDVVIALRTFKFVNGKVNISGSELHHLSVQYLIGNIVEVLEHLDWCPWCCFTNLNLVRAINYSSLEKLT